MKSTSIDGLDVPYIRPWVTLMSSVKSTNKGKNLDKEFSSSKSGYPTQRDTLVLTISSRVIPEVAT